MSSPSITPLELVNIAIDVAIFTIKDNQLSAVLLRRDSEPFKSYLTLPGGVLKRRETTKQAAVRILEDKVNVKDVFIEQLFTFDDPNRDPRSRVLSVTYFALVQDAKLKHLADNVEITPVSEVNEMGFDHKKILDYAVSRLRAKLAYTNAAYSLLPRLFTLSELQKVYEIILDQEIDKRNFRKKILSLDVIDKTEEMQRGRKHRPARLYTFKKHSPQELLNPAFYKKDV